MLLPNVANPTAITSIRLLLIMLTFLCTCEGKAHSRTSYLTMTHVGCSSGNAMRPTTTVAATSRGLFNVPRPDAAGVRLRQVYAELDGMIGGSHKSESCMLFPKILDTVRAAAPSQAA